MYSYNDCFDLRLVSIHDHVINLQVESWKHLLIVGDSILEQGPATIGLSNEEFKFFKTTFSEDLTTSFNQNCLEIKGRGKECSLYWRDGQAVSFAPQRYKYLDTTAVKRSVKEYRNMLLNKPLPTAAAVLFDLPGGESYFRQKIKKYYPELVNAILRKRKTDLLQHCREIAGMGKGLTPTGDDLIHSALLAFHYFVYDANFLKLFEDDFRMISKNNTNIFGVHMHELGLAGLTPMVVISLLESIAAGKPDPQILRKVLTVGSCTGYDMAIALLYFLGTIYV